MLVDFFIWLFNESFKIETISNKINQINIFLSMETSFAVNKKILNCLKVKITEKDKCLFKKFF